MNEITDEETFSSMFYDSAWKDLHFPMKLASVEI